MGSKDGWAGIVYHIGLFIRFNLGINQIMSFLPDGYLTSCGSLNIPR